MCPNIKSPWRRESIFEWQRLRWHNLGLIFIPCTVRRTLNIHQWVTMVLSIWIISLDTAIFILRRRREGNVGGLLWQHLFFIAAKPFKISSVGLRGLWVALMQILMSNLRTGRAGNSELSRKRRNYTRNVNIALKVRHCVVLSLNESSPLCAD